MDAEFYLFGSLISGDIDAGSDVDILAVVADGTMRTGIPEGWSVYTAAKIREIFARGTLFAWHVYLESKLVFPANSKGILAELGPPADYENAKYEVAELKALAERAIAALSSGTPSKVFEHGLLYLAARDIAMAASKWVNGEFNFSKYAALQLRELPLPLTRQEYEFLMNCRRASVRGTALTWQPQLECTIKEKWILLVEWCHRVYSAIGNESVSEKNRC